MLTHTAFGNASWSPDGRKIAFVGGGWDNVYVVNADGSGERRLAQKAAWPVWSPDGRRFAFVRGFGANSEVYVINADGSKQRRLTRGAHQPVWSPEGRKIAFESERDGNTELYVVNADGSGQQRLTRNARYDGDPAWSPDGQRIAFVSNWQVSVMNADGSGQQRLTRNAARDLWPVWSPDGRKIAFERQLGWKRYSPCSGCGKAMIYEIHVMNADGSGQRRLIRERVRPEVVTDGSQGPGAEPRWSPDGHKIAFRSQRDGNFEVYVMNADGSRQRTLSHSPAEDDCCLAWSPGQT